ncbi:MAG: hypothetical protein WD646_05675 [Actinomycetota bacterium]
MTNQPILRQIDHVFVAVEGARSAFELLRKRLGLVPVFPFSDFGAFASGSFNLGNIFLEILEAMPGFPRSSPGALEVNGIAFEPSPIDDAIAELASRGIAHAPPMEVIVPAEAGPLVPDIVVTPDFQDGMKPGSPMFTNVFLPGFFGDGIVVFGSRHEYAQVSVVRDGMRRRLDDMPDRLLPIDSVAEVVVGAADVESARARWQSLLDPFAGEGPGVWRFEDGPTLRLIENDRDAVVRLVLHVSDLERTKRYLEQHDLLGSEDGHELTIRPAALQGLNLTLVGGD